MNYTNHQTISLWENITQKSTDYPELLSEINVDVAIIGAGITGITAAIELQKKGMKVAILEANTVGSGTTGFSTGNLYIPIQPYYSKICSKFDLETLKLVANARKKAIDYIENMTQAISINCNFTRRPMFLYAGDKSENNLLEEEMKFLRQAKIDIEYTSELPLEVPFSKAAILPNQARFNPVQYLRSLAQLLQQSGCLIFEHSRVVDISEDKNKVVFKTAKSKVIANKGIIATHTPIGFNPIHFFTAPYRSYVVAVKLKDNRYPEFNYWNLKTPHYAISTHSQSHSDPDLLVIAGNHHKTGQSNNTQAHFDELEQYLRDHFAVEKRVYHWSAQHYHTADGLPYIGLAKQYKNIYEATGFFADGLVYGCIAGVVLAEKLTNNHATSFESKTTLPTSYFTIFNSKRHNFMASLKFLIKENINVFLEYLKDFPQLSTQKYKKIKRGEAGIFTIQGEKCGVYKDQQDKLHVVSAVCTHMSCIVNWNNAERTWDCPCHGSRFTHQGKVIEGPAKEDLANKTG